MGWAGLTALPVILAIIDYIVPPRLKERLLQNLDVGPLSNLPLNSAKIVKFNKQAIALVRTADGQVRSFSAVCTHLGCIVQYVPERHLFHCNCHGSEFDLTGKNIAGPAPRPLQPFRTDIKGSDIVISQI